jgi:hypothetical protein
MRSLSFLFLLLLCSLFHDGLAQDNNTSGKDEISLNLLRAPASPAATMLGISPSQIEKPADPAAFMTSISTATENFSVIPTNYAVDIAPAWLFWGDSITLKDYLSPKSGNSIAQSFVISMATTTKKEAKNSSLNVTRFSTGIKFSILRGEIDTATKADLIELQDLMKKLILPFALGLEALEKNNPDYQKLVQEENQIMTDTTKSFPERDSLTAPIRKKKIAIEQSIKQSMMEAKDKKDSLATRFDEVRRKSESIRINRFGGKLDFAGALVWNFPGMTFSKGSLNSAGAWLTGGWEGKKGFSVLGMLRYLYNPGDSVFIDETTTEIANLQLVDAGLRLIYNHPVSKFGFSGEALFRNFLNDDSRDPTWRFMINAEYEVGRNKKLSLSFGKDFDLTLSKDGQVIVALNLLLGFGTTKHL